MTSCFTKILATDGRVNEAVTWSIRSGLPTADAIENNASLHNESASKEMISIHEQWATP